MNTPTVSNDNKDIRDLIQKSEQLMDLTEKSLKQTDALSGIVQKTLDAQTASLTIIKKILGLIPTLVLLILLVGFRKELMDVVGWITRLTKDYIQVVRNWSREEQLRSLVLPALGAGLLFLVQQIVKAVRSKSSDS